MSGTGKETIIKIEGLKKTYVTGFFRKRTEALRGVDLEVYRNEILGFLGPNGAGKTTTIKVLLGIVYPTAGTATVLGQPLGSVTVKNRIGFLPEQPYFYDYLKGREFMDFYARFHPMEKGERKKRINELLEMVGVGRAADIPLRKYSKGMLQRIGMAQALLGDPELVILDEPMSGLDPLGRRDMREIIFRLKEKGKTVFFSSHILPDVEQICDRVCIINKGRIKDTGSLADILKPKVQMVDLQFEGLGREAADAIAALDSSFPGLRVIEKGGLLLVTAPGWEAADQAEKKGKEMGGRMVVLQPQRENLEDHFLREIDDRNGEDGK